ncbi:hypothetical protein [Cupriavidus sp. PET2-C1]
MQANYGRKPMRRWQRASRQVFSAPVQMQPHRADLALPACLQRWRAAHVSLPPSPGTGKPATLKLHVPARLCALIQARRGYRLDCLVEGGEAWLIGMHALGEPALRHDLLAEWEQLSQAPDARRPDAAEEWLVNPVCSQRAQSGHGYLLATAGLLCALVGMMLCARFQPGALALLPAALALGLFLLDLHRQMWPATRARRLIAIDAPLERLNVRVPPGTAQELGWYRCGALLFAYQHRVLEPADGRGAQMHVNKTPGWLKLSLAYSARGNPMAMRDPQTLRQWARYQFGFGVIALQTGMLAALALFHPSLLDGVNVLRPQATWGYVSYAAAQRGNGFGYDPWVVLGCALCVAVLGVVWYRSRRSLLTRLGAEADAWQARLGQAPERVAPLPWLGPKGP